MKKNDVSSTASSDDSRKAERESGGRVTYFCDFYPDVDDEDVKCDV